MNDMADDHVGATAPHATRAAEGPIACGDSFANHRLPDLEACAFAGARP